MPRLIRKRPRDVIRGRLRDCIISILANNVASVQLRRRYRLEARLAPVPSVAARDSFARYSSPSATRKLEAFRPCS